MEVKTMQREFVFAVQGARLIVRVSPKCRVYQGNCQVNFYYEAEAMLPRSVIRSASWFVTQRHFLYGEHKQGVERVLDELVTELRNWIWAIYWEDLFFVPALLEEYIGIEVPSFQDGIEPTSHIFNRLRKLGELATFLKLIAEFFETAKLTEDELAAIIGVPDDEEF